MRKTLAILAFMAAFPANALFADTDCFVQMVDWQPRDVVARYAVSQGWEVRRIKIDDGCYEIEGHDTQGRAIEVKLHPATLEILEFEFEDDDHDREHDGQGHD